MTTSHPLDDLARIIDARLRMAPSMRAPGRLFAVHADPDGLDDPDDLDGVRLRLLDVGDPREIVRRPRVPADAIALAHSALGWSAPLPDAGTPAMRPSLHPERRRAHTTTVVGGTGTVWSVVRIGDDAPQVWPDGVGTIPERLQRAWVDARTRPQRRAS